MAKGTGFLPLSLLDYIPRGLKSQVSLSRDAMATKMDSHLSEWIEEITFLPTLLNPFKTESKFLKELEYYLSPINWNDSDTTAVKRAKLANAVAGQKKKDSFENDVRIRVDAITGYTSDIYKPTILRQWAFTGDGVVESGNYLSSIGCDAIDYDLGIALLGEGIEPEIPGVVCINLHTAYDYPILSEATVQAVYYEVNVRDPYAYLRIRLGYVNAADVWVDYDGAYVYEPFILDDLSTFELSDGDDFYVSTSDTISY